MSAARFRPPTKHRPMQHELAEPVTASQRRARPLRPGRRSKLVAGIHYHAAEPMVPTPLRRSGKSWHGGKAPSKATIKTQQRARRRREAGS